jgi:hypothetical protein
MSRENVELLRRFVDAWNRRDIEAMIALCDPGVEYHSVYAAVGGAVYHGHAHSGGPDVAERSVPRWWEWGTQRPDVAPTNSDREAAGYADSSEGGS